MVFLFFSVGSAYSQTQKLSLSKKNITVTVDGSKLRGIVAYKSDQNVWYLAIKDIAKIYNGAFEWKPISSIVTMIINNKKIDFSPNDKTVLFGRSPKEMRVSSKLVGNNVYIPMEILTGAAFSNFALVDSLWDPQKLTLTLIHRPNITSIKYYTRPEETRVEIMLNQKLPFSVSRDNDAINVRINRGKVAPTQILASNGALASIVSENTGKTATIKINLEQTPTSIKATESATLPERITIIIAHAQKLSLQNLKNDKNNSENIEQLENISVAPIEAGIDNSDLNQVPVESFDVQTLPDESFSIVDDVSTFKDIAQAVTGKKNKDAKIIVIDAGHGGTDPGAIGPRGTKEKDITLEIAYELKKLFDKNPDYIPVLTRKDDVFIPLAQRTQIANDRKANLFISIHCNANINRKVGGFEIFFLAERATDAEALATENLENSSIELEGKPTPQLANIQKMLWSMMQNEFLNESSELSSFIDAVAKGKLKIPNRGVKQAGFYVLRGAAMPAVLIETAFI
ncbi:MAG: N-acetylmuramoyl-L-alanine amidase, partial [Elusimicrobiota bacterium]|nr:N-acetylmuramoyl-L-alanine amidase [Elusimicrobiota bacterium]